MSDAQKALAKRIRELRRRHFGSGGKDRFAQRLGIDASEYARYEREALPDGELMVRMCELTGEDLQWLLTGRAARGTVVISGARERHRDLVARVAGMLDANPTCAGALEAFLDLLQDAREHAKPGVDSLPPPEPQELIPVFSAADLPENWPDPDNDDNGGFPIALREISAEPEPGPLCRIDEPAEQYDAAGVGQVALVSISPPGQPPRRYIRAAGIAAAIPNAFAVEIEQDDMAPMFERGDLALVAVGVEPHTARPALCRVVGETQPRCRIWLGKDAGGVCLGRVGDGEQESVASDRLQWSLEILYRIARAA